MGLLASDFLSQGIVAWVLFAHWDFAFREVTDEQVSFPVVLSLQSQADCLGETVVELIL